MAKREDSVNYVYEYIDSYYKPSIYTIKDWIANKRSLRIRESIKPKDKIVHILTNEIKQTGLGFYGIDPFGTAKWFSGEKSRAVDLLEDHAMELFYKVIKNGIYAKMIEDNYKIYSESIEFEESDGKRQKYGNSIEIELMVDDPKKLWKIKDRKERIIKQFELETCKSQTVPVQELIFNRIAGK